VLLSQSAVGRLRVIVPEVVVREAVGKFRRTVEERLTKHTAAVRDLRRLGIGIGDGSVPDATQASAGYEAELRQRLAGAGAEVPAVPSVDILRLVDNAIARKKPFDERGSGFRDALIWSTVMEVGGSWVVAAPLIAFVTGNTKDFCGEDGHSLADDLAEELEAAGRAVVRVYKSIEDFVLSGITDDPVLYQRVQSLVEDDAAQIASNIEMALRLAEIDVLDAIATVTVTDVSDVRVQLSRVGSLDESSPDALVELDAVAHVELEIYAFRSQDDHEIGGVFGTELQFGATARFDQATGELCDLDVSGVSIYSSDLFGW